MAIEELHDSVWDILDGKGTGKDAFGNAMTVAFRCMDAGLTKEDYHELIEGSALADSLHGKKDGKYSKQWKRSAEKAWDFADKKYQPAEHMPEQYIKDLFALRRRVAEFTFPGRSKAADKHTALVLIDWAMELGYPGVKASTRSLGLKTGVSHMSAARSVRRLAALDLITIKPSNKHGVPDELYVNRNWEAQRETVTSMSRGGCRIDVTLYLSDGLDEVFFRGAGIGPSASIIFTALSAREADEWMTVKELAEVTGLDPSTVRNNLRKMIEPGLVEAREHVRPATYRQHPEADLDHAAKVVGADGEREYRSNKILIDRLNWNNYLAIRQGRATPDEARMASDAGVLL